LSYKSPDGQSLNSADLTGEQIVAVFGVLGDGNQQLKADLIVVLPPP